MGVFSVVLVVVAIFAAYLIGGLPFSYWIAKRARGKDIRKYGSGNVGATNVYRAFGWQLAIPAGVLDVAKGSVAVGLVMLAMPDGVGGMWRDIILASVVIAAVAGHATVPWIRGSGGKGIATSAGALLVITPELIGAMLVVFVVVVAITRIVSVGSIVVAFLYPASVAYYLRDRPALIIFAFTLAVVVLFLHRYNIERLLRGEEKKIKRINPSDS